MKIVLALAALSLVKFPGGIRAEDNFRSSYFTIQSERRLTGQVIKKFIADSELSCAHKCLALNCPLLKLTDRLGLSTQNDPRKQR